MKHFYTLLFVALPYLIFAQSNYHEGYVVKNNGDTLKGFIDYHEWEQNPTSIDFKINKDDRKPLKFAPREIKGFQINGMESYSTYKGLISMDRTKFPDLPLGRDTSKKVDTVYLRQIVNGKYLTLFYLKDDVKVRFFIAEGNKQPVELEYAQYYNDQNQLTVRNVYKGQLIFYADKFASGHDKLVNKINNAYYAQSDLEIVVSEINGDSSGLNKKAPSVRFFAGAALNNTKTQFASYILQTSTTASPKIDFGFDMFANPNVQQFVIRVEMSLSYVNAKFQYPSNYTFNQLSATFCPQIMFNFYNTDNLKIYLDAGVGFNLSAYTNNKNDSIEKPYDLESYWANFPLQAGIILHKKLEFSFTYAGYTAYTKYADLSISNQTMGVGVKYLFGNK